MTVRALIAMSFVLATSCRVARTSHPSGATSLPAHELSVVLQERDKAAFQRSWALKLAKHGQCGAALFHWIRGASPKTRPADIPKSITACKKRLQADGSKQKSWGWNRLWRPLQGPIASIPEGLTYWGSNDAQKDWTIRHLGSKAPRDILQWPVLDRVLVHGFSISRHEITATQWQRCRFAGKCSGPTQGRGREPVRAVTFAQASAYCTWAGGRLPSEREWERAARFPEEPQAPWPWGKSWIEGCSVLERPDAKGPAPVGTHPCDISPQGVVDMGGNVAEWVVGPDSAGAHGLALVKGGWWSASRYEATVFFRQTVPRNRRDRHVGFRCLWPKDLGTDGRK